MFKILAASAAALFLAGSAAAGEAAPSTKLFADSRLVVRDRFSDEIVGKGSDLVLIPGLASSRATWKVTAERLRGRYRLHLIQIAGFAGEPARGNASGEVLVPTAEAIDAYLVEQKLTPAVLVGHSLGGTTILYLAEKHPEHLKKALMVDALPFFGSLFAGPGATSDSVRPMAERMRQSIAAGQGKVTAAQLEPQMAQMSKDGATRHLVAEWGASSDRDVVARALYDDLTLDLRAGLPAVRTPITLVYPDDVPVGAPAGMMEKVYPASYAPATTLKARLVADSAHFVMFDEPQAFAQALDEFLSHD